VPAAETWSARSPGTASSRGAGPEIDLAYHFIRACWGNGYGTEAAVAVLAHGLGPVGLDCIMAVVVPQNVGSWRVMEKAGMRYAGLVDYYGLEGLKKYVAAREWWRPPRLITTRDSDDQSAADVAAVRRVSHSSLGGRGRDAELGFPRG
jgi:RimJ/RimL family protein N-acetyltransferase